MRTFILVSLALFSSLSPAFADVEPTEIKPLAANADPCKVLGGDAKTCRKVATTKLEDIGPATLYRVDQEGTVTFGIVVDDQGKLAMTAPITVNTSDCGAGKCDSLVKATPVLKALKIGAGPTVALDLTLARTRESNEGPKNARNYTVRQFVACRIAKGVWSCKQAQFGSLDEACTATLSMAGQIKSRCERTTPLWF